MGLFRCPNGQPMHRMGSDKRAGGGVARPLDLWEWVPPAGDHRRVPSLRALEAGSEILVTGTVVPGPGGIYA
jgi:hypothetical protein